MTLELRPGCEHCDCDLPPDSDQAMICTYECTFCLSCVKIVLEDICPNCGGNFVNRPIRPAQPFVNGLSLSSHPPPDNRTFKPVDLEAHAKLLDRIKAAVS